MIRDSRLKRVSGETERRFGLDPKDESGGARQRNRPTLPALEPISERPVTPTFTLYTDPDLVKRIWEGTEK